MSLAINTRFALGSIDDLTTPTLVQNYTLGSVVEIYNSSTKVVDKYMYVKSHGALTQYQPYVLDIGSTAGAEIVTKAPATLAAPGAIVVVPQVGFTSGYYGWVLIEGIGKVLMTAETYALGDHLQVLTTGTALLVDGTTGSTAYSVNTCAICKEAGTTAVSRSFYLFNRQAVVAAT